MYSSFRKHTHAHILRVSINILKHRPFYPRKSPIASTLLKHTLRAHWTKTKPLIIYSYLAAPTACNILARQNSDHLRSPLISSRFPSHNHFAVQKCTLRSNKVSVDITSTPLRCQCALRFIFVHERKCAENTARSHNCKCDFAMWKRCFSMAIGRNERALCAPGATEIRCGLVVSDNYGVLPCDQLNYGGVRGSIKENCPALSAQKPNTHALKRSLANGQLQLVGLRRACVAFTKDEYLSIRTIFHSKKCTNAYS